MEEFVNLAKEAVKKKNLNWTLQHYCREVEKYLVYICRLCTELVMSEYSKKEVMTKKKIEQPLLLFGRACK